MNIYNMRPNANGLPELVDAVYSKANHLLSMIEIGSYAGQSMEIFAKTKKISKIICIDPWKKGYDSMDLASSTDMNEVERLFDNRLCIAKKIPVDVIKHKGTINTFIQTELFSSVMNNVDFVYIDGCHTYDSVKNDITLSLEKIQPIVAICGHDWSPGWKDVKKAILDTIGNPDKIFSDTSWLKFI